MKFTKTLGVKSVKTLVILLSFFAYISAFAGPSDSGGGAFVKAKFMSKAQTIAKQLRIPGKNIHDINLTKLDILLEGIDLSVTLKPLNDKNGEPVDALNFPKQKKLVLYGPSWDKILSNDEVVYITVYHELISLLGFDDEHNKLSSKVQFSPPTWSCFAYCGHQYFQKGYYVKFEDVLSEGSSAATTYSELYKNCLKSKIKIVELDVDHEATGVGLFQPKSVMDSNIMYEVTTMNESCAKN
ncbi:MAG: hypothetical protein AABY64_10305 [Bdellovibrionota bacterium]